MGSKYDQTYQKAHQKYREAVKSGSRPADGQSDKARAMNEVVAIEREAAREGINLSAAYRGDQVVVSHTEGDTKKSLQQEYVRKFDNEVETKIDGKEQTLRDWHRKRLGV